MTKSDIDKAAKLLAKAASTDYEPEAMALVERCYGLLAKVLTDLDEAQHSASSSAAAQRRERRRIADRRRDRRPAKAGAAQQRQAAIDKFTRVATERDQGPGRRKNILI